MYTLVGIPVAVPVGRKHCTQSTKLFELLLSWGSSAVRKLDLLYNPDNRFKEFDLGSIPKHCPNLEKLIISSFSILNMRSVLELKQLKSISIDYKHSIKAKDLIDILSLPTLEEVKILNITINNKGEKSVVNALESHGRLKKLWAPSYIMIQCRPSKFVALQKLTLFHSSNIKVGSNEWISWCNRMEEFPQLKAIRSNCIPTLKELVPIGKIQTLEKFHWQKLVAVGFESRYDDLFNELMNCQWKNLQILDISIKSQKKENLMSAQREDVNNLLRKYPNLRELSLIGFKFGEMEALEHKSLQKLELDYVSFFSEGVLASLPNLKHLRYRGFMSDAETIAKECPKLESLILYNPSFEGLLHLLENLSQLRRLELILNDRDPLKNNEEVWKRCVAKHNPTLHITKSK
eukprot:TRINITY_DN4743_c0_g1_i1.p1 TRINITY_DN4743_c0_g1~~TRINITY_DN4743_c0_g1_i1.p1  ORF type:complete len:405 (-),score=110.80 TRINITY_DN4743_c0_g1_i1:138-1352(-)